MLTRLWLAIGLALLGLQTVHGQGFALQFGSTNNPGQTTFSAAPGNSLIVQLFLTQTGGETRLDSAATGLAFADFDFGVSNIVDLDTSAFTVGSGLTDVGSTALVPTGVNFNTASDAAIANSGTMGLTATSNSILLGTATIDVALLAAGSYGLTLTPRDGGLGAFALADPVFPATITVAPGSATLDISPIPEPSSLLMLAGSSLLLVRRRRR